MRRRCTLPFSSFLLLPLPAPSPFPARASADVVPRAERQFPERGPSQCPAGPLAAVTKPPQGKHRSAIQPRARHLMAWCKLVLFAVLAGPSRCLKGTKFDINSKCLCASISPATAKLVSPPYQAGCWRALPVDEEAPATCMGARNVCAYPRCSTSYDNSGRGAFHAREASQFAGESSEHSVPFPDRYRVSW